MMQGHSDRQISITSIALIQFTNFNSFIVLLLLYQTFYRYCKYKNCVALLSSIYFLLYT